MKKTLWRLLLILLLTLLIPAAAAADQDVYYPEADMHIQLPGNWFYLTREMAKDPAIARGYGMTTEEMQEWLSGGDTGTTSQYIGVFYQMKGPLYAHVFTVVDGSLYSLEMLGNANRELYLKRFTQEYSFATVTESFWVELGGQYWCALKFEEVSHGTIEKTTVLRTLHRNKVVNILIQGCEDAPGLDPVVEEIMQTVTFEQEPYTVEGYPEITPAVEDYQIGDCICLDLPKNWTVSEQEESFVLSHAMMDFGVIVVTEGDLWDEVKGTAASREEVDMDYMTPQEYREYLGKKTRYVGQQTFGDYTYYIYRDETNGGAPVMLLIHLQDAVEFGFTVSGDETGALYDEATKILASITYATQGLPEGEPAEEAPVVEEEPAEEPVEELPAVEEATVEMPEEAVDETPAEATAKGGSAIWIVILLAAAGAAVGVAVAVMSKKKKSDLKRQVCPLCGTKSKAGDLFCRECGNRFHQ